MKSKSPQNPASHNTFSNNLVIVLFFGISLLFLYVCLSLLLTVAGAQDLLQNFMERTPTAIDLFFWPMHVDIYRSLLASIGDCGPWCDAKIMGPMLGVQLLYWFGLAAVLQAVRRIAHGKKV